MDKHRHKTSRERRNIYEDLETYLLLVEGSVINPNSRESQFYLILLDL